MNLVPVARLRPRLTSEMPRIFRNISEISPCPFGARCITYYLLKNPPPQKKKKKTIIQNIIPILPS